jgi:phytoene dehydrogenase-like protein
MDRNTNKVDTIIVGGGLAGLATATYLARAGHSVTLFEKSATAGGRAETTEQHGFYFNLGAHALYRGSKAMEVLQELGIKFTGGSPGDLGAVWKGKVHLLPADTRSLLRTSLLTAGEKWQAGRLLFALQMMKPKEYDRMTLTEWLSNQRATERVHRLIEAAARVSTYTDAPDRMSLGFLAEQLRIAQKGVVYVDKGWQTLVDGLLDAARSAGAQIVTGAHVEKVEMEAGEVRGVRMADGTVFAADSVVIAASPRDAARLVAEGEAVVLKEWAEKTVPVKAACLDLGLRKLPRPYNKVVLSLDGPFFQTVQSPFSRIAPEGMSLVYTIKYLRPDEKIDAHAVERELEGYLDVTQPGWRDEVLERRYMPNLTVNNALVTAEAGGVSGRPAPDVPGVEGLYVAGDWVCPEGNISSASLWSAKLASRMILERQGDAKLSKAA